jgi:PAS domain S-box-containing protein
MKSFTSQITSNLLGKSGPGAEEVFALLNLQEEPCALVDLSADKIIFLNSRLIKATSFTTADLRDKNTGFLFPNLDVKAISSGEFREIDLNRRGQTPIHARVKFDFIGTASHLVVIRILAHQSSESNVEPEIEGLIDQLILLTKVSEGSDVNQILPQLMRLICLILNVETAAIFQADPSYPSLKCVCLHGRSTDLPAELPSTDLIRLTEPAIWNAGDRAITDIHKYARMNSVEYVATAPLKLDDAAIGIIVVCGKGVLPRELRISVLQYLSIHILNFLQKSMLIKNLQDRIVFEQQRMVARNATFENMQEAVIVLNNELEIIEINQAAEWMLNYAEQEVLGQPYDNVLIGTDKLQPALEDAKKGNTTHNLGKANLNRRNGQSFPTQMKVIPVMRDKKVYSIEVLLADISENEQQKALTQQLENRALLGDYTAAIAHDLRNPINSIYTGIQLLGMKLAPDDPNQDNIGRIQNDCTRLNNLLESLMSSVRTVDTQLELIDLDVYLHKIVDRWRPKFAKVNVNPVFNIQANLSKIMGDPKSLDRVFTNLITNALDAMAEKGDTLAVTAVMNKEIVNHPFVDISITDNGPGIPEDVKEHLFSPYMTTRKKGTGLGLFLTKQIVTAHKGSISVNSFPGGTVFTIRLPAEDGEVR